MPNAMPETDVAAAIAQRTLARRGADYAGEVRRLLDAALVVMRRCGTTSRPRVADIVAEAGLSNEAFYRHFPSKDALVEALLEDGAARLASYLAHQMAKERTPERRVRRWVDGVLAQAGAAAAATTIAVLWNGGGPGAGPPGRHLAGGRVAALLHEPFLALGSGAPELHSSLAAHATVGRLSEHLWAGTEASRAEVDRITAFWLAAVLDDRR